MFYSGEVCAFRILYPNGTVDVFRGWLSSLGKAVTSTEVMTRTIKITGIGRPHLAEECQEVVSVTGVTVTPMAVTLHPGETSKLTFVLVPENASDKTLTVFSTDPQTATVSLSGLVATVSARQEGTVSIVGMSGDGRTGQVVKVTVAPAEEKSTGRTRG
ncbi:bacterial Ig-like domain family protein [Escherichia coli MP021552.7]|nr:bacterial Ig-like domain family protein [Escherichia coli MP021552.7]